VAYDVAVIGAGHNGLVAACDLARSGLKVVVLERREILGGACCSEALWPGYRVSTASYVTTLFDPRIVRDFGLEARGYTVYKQEPAFFHPFPDGRFLVLHGDEERDAREYGKFSPRDARALPAFHLALGRLADLTRVIATVPPPRLPWPRLRDLPTMVALAREVLRLRPADLSRLVDVATSGILDFIEPWFESEQVRGFYCSQGVIGAYGGVHTPGTAALLLHDFLGGVEGARGVWGVVKGGMGTIAEALASAARDMGVEIRSGTPVLRILVEEGRKGPAGRAVGVALGDGTVVESRAVASGADPRRTFLDLVGGELLPPDFREGIERYRCLGASLKVHLALSELPDFVAMPGRDPGPQHRGLVVLCPSPAYIERAWDEAKGGDLSRAPMLECCIPSVLDPTVAPPGCHVMSCFVQYGARHLREGSWEARKPEVTRRVLDVLETYAPNVKRSVIASHVYTPEDLETQFGLTGGNIYQGAMTPEQLFAFRPAAGYGSYRTPVEGLYLCGAGAHPGGGVWGLAGRNAAREILRDLRVHAPVLSG
jgi:phytoene dehydrogenase-like protein